MKKTLLKLTGMLLLGGSLMFITSCSKEDCNKDTSGGGRNSEMSEAEMNRTKGKINNFIRRFPSKSLVHELKNRGNASSTNHPMDFTFANPAGGYTYSYTSTYTTSNGTTYTTNSYTVYAVWNMFGAGANGGTVVAGTSSLDINYTFCFSASDQGFGLDLFRHRSSY
ncbi:MAG: hypothetical protein ABUL44_03590 [Flavobacterium sp.]